MYSCVDLYIQHDKNPAFFPTAPFLSCRVVYIRIKLW